MSAPHFEAVLFDCDGVLADSETLTNGVLREMLAERGWRLTVDECMLQFVGKAVSDEAALIEQKTGAPVTEDWLASFRSRRNTALASHLNAIPHVADAVHRIHAGHSGRIACAPRFLFIFSPSLPISFYRSLHLSCSIPGSLLLSFSPF